MLEKAKGVKQDQQAKDPVEEIEYDPEQFNPFDRASIKREEQQEAIKPKQARKVLAFKKK